MPAGRPPSRPLCPHFCPTCGKRLYQHGKRTSYRCNCGRSYDLVDGEIRPKVKRAKQSEEKQEEKWALEWWEVEELNGWEPVEELVK